MIQFRNEINQGCYQLEKNNINHFNKLVVVKYLDASAYKITKLLCQLMMRVLIPLL